MNHKKADWKRRYLTPGQLTAVYPFKGEPFVGRVSRVTKNRYMRISYVVDGINVMAEELFPADGQDKLMIKYQGKA